MLLTILKQYIFNSTLERKLKNRRVPINKIHYFPIPVLKSQKFSDKNAKAPVHIKYTSRWNLSFTLLLLVKPLVQTTWLNISLRPPLKLPPSIPSLLIQSGEIHNYSKPYTKCPGFSLKTLQNLSTVWTSNGSLQFIETEGLAGLKWWHCRTQRTVERYLFPKNYCTYMKLLP